MGAGTIEVATGVATIWGVATLVFVAFRCLPGDPAVLVLGEHATFAERLALRARLHLDEPLVRQYGEFLRGLFRGQLGPSLRSPDVDASRIVTAAFPSTAALAALGVALGTLGGLFLAVVAVAGERRIARNANGIIALCASVPLLGVAPVATWALAVRLRWVPLPADPQAGLAGLAFAAALLAVPLAGAVARVARGSLLEAAASPFLQVARAKGRSPVAVWIVHALPPCAGPIVTVVAAQLGALLGGAIVLERLLERQGLGTVLAEALASRDLPVIEAAVIASATLFVAAQLVGARLHRGLDPRAR